MVRISGDGFDNPWQHTTALPHNITHDVTSPCSQKTHFDGQPASLPSGPLSTLSGAGWLRLDEALLCTQHGAADKHVYAQHTNGTRRREVCGAMCRKAYEVREAHAGREQRTTARNTQQNTPPVSREPAPSTSAAAHTLPTSRAGSASVSSRRGASPVGLLPPPLPTSAAPPPVRPSVGPGVVIPLTHSPGRVSITTPQEAETSGAEWGEVERSGAELTRTKGVALGGWVGLANEASKLSAEGGVPLFFIL